MDLFNAGEDVYNALENLVRRYHPDLIDVMDQILVVFKDKASTPGGVTIFGKVQKAPPLLAKGLVTEKNKKYTYIITIGFDAWNLLSDKQKTALLDHFLCSMTVTVDKDDNIKYGVKPPDFVGYREEIERWGLWRPESEPQAPTLVEQIFGKPKVGDSQTTEEDLLQ